MKRILTISLLLLFITCVKANNTSDSIAIRFSKTINKEELSRHLHVLASDAYLGRETGKKGQKMAAEYIANYFKGLGLPAIGENKSYYQVFNVIEQMPGGSIAINGKSYSFIKDFYFFPGIEDTTLKIEELLFLGYGIDDKNYSDYNGVDVKNKIILILSGEPLDKKGNSFITKTKNTSSWSNDIRRKLNLAKEKGVSSVIVIQDHYLQSVEYLRHYIESPTMRLEIEKSEKKERKRTPAFFINPELQNEIIANKEIQTLKNKILKKKKPVRQIIKTNLSISIKREEKTLSSENVLGYIEGTDLKNELIIITAHYDHIGTDGKEIYNGADDDGSGTVAIMEIAEAFQLAANAGYRPRRSILIMPVSGEEKGLLGSYYYSEKPVFPLENTVANLNIDMIGRLDTFHINNPNYIYLIGSNILSQDLHDLSETANSTYTKLDLDYRYNDISDPNRYYYRSDHYNFARKKIPVIFYFNGVHADYHKPTDEVEKIDFKKMEKITRLVFFTAWMIANRDARPALNQKN